MTPEHDIEAQFEAVMERAEQAAARLDATELEEALEELERWRRMAEASGIDCGLAAQIHSRVRAYRDFCSFMLRTVQSALNAAMCSGDETYGRSADGSACKDPQSLPVLMQRYG